MKMLSGGYAYDNEKTCEYSMNCRRSLQQALKVFDQITFTGISEMWELSIFLLYMKLVHEKQLHIQPRIEELGLHQIVRYQSKSSVLPLQSWTSRAKKNIWDHDRTYLMEKYRIELAHQNNLDLKLYIYAIRAMCTYLQSSGLWTKYRVIQQYWREKIVDTKQNVEECS